MKALNNNRIRFILTTDLVSTISTVRNGFEFGGQTISVLGDIAASDRKFQTKTKEALGASMISLDGLADFIRAGGRCESVLFMERFEPIKGECLHLANAACALAELANATTCAVIEFENQEFLTTFGSQLLSLIRPFDPCIEVASAESYLSIASPLVSSLREALDDVWAPFSLE